MLGAVMAGMFVVMYVGAIGMAVIHYAQSPLFHPYRFDVRVNGSKVKMIGDYHVFELKHSIHNHERTFNHV